MHGLIHVIFRGFVVDKFGESAWKEILKIAGIEDESTLFEMKHYDDSLTMAAVKIGADVAGAPLDAALELFGSYFVDYAAGAGFIRLLRSLGPDLHQLLSNLNILHHNVERDLPAAVFPIFEVSQVEWINDYKYRFRMDYASSRAGLGPLLKGALHQATNKLFNSTLEISELSAEALRKMSFLPSAEASHELHWNLTVTINQEKPDFDATPSTTATSAPSAAEASFSFFDFHSALASAWCCCAQSQNDEIMVTVPTQPVVQEDWVNDVKMVLAEKRSRIEGVTATYPSSSDGKHQYFSMNAMDRIRVGATLFRACSADLVSSPWTDLPEMEKTEFFWGAYTKLDNFYAISKDWLVESQTMNGQMKFHKKGKIRFLSQSWGIPKEWDDLMGAGSYAEAKAAEICCVAKDIAARELGSTSRWKEVHFWVDKCCIPQGDQELTGWCVNLLEEYIIFCDGLVVLVPWTYFTRLWCVYEWVCFLLCHDPMDIEICADPFVRESTLPLFIDAIGNFKLSSCQCFREADRPILYNKVEKYYKSIDSFEKFLKFTAIALFVRCTAQRRSAKAVSALEPWRYLAERQGFSALADRISEMMQKLPEWREGAVKSATGGGTNDVQTAVLQQVEEWFKAKMVPMIVQMRKESATESGLKFIEELRKAAKEVVFQENACEPIEEADL
ncbi:unnamed protein product [Cladocopium goreaui]|uniref:Soluble guanylate cyclase gcy-36 n=1 Tax=Cladocopium goreaui TaxID=2562237 RepID=A0A9P1GFX4_9DINO|nr:unnamed protein product [Cladocopium goreaui]